jgi:hypothetical protein
MGIVLHKDYDIFQGGNFCGVAFPNWHYLTPHAYEAPAKYITLKTSLKFAQEQIIIGIVRFISGLTLQEKTHLPYKNTRMNGRWQIYRYIAFEDEDSDAVRPSMRC